MKDETTFRYADAGDSNTGGSDLWSSTLPLDHGGPRSSFDIFSIKTPMTTDLYQSQPSTCSNLLEFDGSVKVSLINASLIKFKRSVSLRH